MRYYTWHIGDYARDAGHLSHVEDAIYRRLLDVYYATERPLPLKQTDVFLLSKSRKNFELLATKRVLKQFFVKCEDGYHNKRADAEIAKFKAKSEVRSKVAKAGWSSRPRDGTRANAMQLHNGVDANAFLPSPISHSPESKSKNPLSPPLGAKGGNGRKRRSEHRREQDVAAKMWHQLLASGGSDPPRTADLQEAIDACGGWSAIQGRTAKDEPRLRATFCHAYATGDS